MVDISKKILQKIKEKGIKPHSKEYFFFIKFIIWTLFSLSFLFGIFASSMAIFQFTHADWDLYHRFKYSLFEFVLLAIPYFWLIILIIFSGFSYYYFRRTDKGYKYNALLIVSLCIILSILGGGVINKIGFSEKLENIFQEKCPFYGRMNFCGHRMWIDPEQGLLAGKIIKIKSVKEIELKDLHGNKWTIDISDAFWRGWLKPEVGIQIKLIGKMIGKSHFIAEEVRPMMGCRGRHCRMHRW